MLYKFFSLICFLFITFVLFGQTTPVKKVYAYSQQIIPGKKPSKEIKLKEHYRVFIVSDTKQIIQINGIWIKQNYYRFTVSGKLKTPVQMNGAEEQHKILVPKTTNRVVELILTGLYEPSPRPGATLSKLLITNEVVIAYQWKGKEYFAPAKTIKELSPFIGM